MNETTARDERPEDGMAQALQLVAQQAAALVEMDRSLKLLLERAENVGTSARGSGERILVADLVEKAVVSLTTNTKRTYEGYMRLLSDGDMTLTGADGKPWKGLGTMWADEVLPSHLERALTVVDLRASARAEGRAVRREEVGRTVRRTDGKGARYNAIGAWRCLLEVAIKDRHLAEGMNPALKLKKPTRVKGGRRGALEEQHYSQMVHLLSATGDDPELDAMVVRFIDVTGARQEGLLNLHFEDIDRSECTVRLHEKFDSHVDQPVPDYFIDELIEFARRRGATKRGDQVFRKRLGLGRFEDITPRRFNYIFCDRLQASFEWADRLQVTAHTLRHHATTKVERHASKAVSTAFARHSPGRDTNEIYTEASPREVARAVVEIHGGDHPWLHREQRPRR